MGLAGTICFVKIAMCYFSSQSVNNQASALIARQYSRRHQNGYRRSALALEDYQLCFASKAVTDVGFEENQK